MAKKLICLLLALMMMLTAAVSCKDGGSATKDTEAETTPEGTTTEKETYVSSSVDDPDEPDGVLIANEGASKYVIVRGENASPSEVTAANELQSYLKKITNVELTVVTDATAETKYEIVVGKTNREEAGEFDRDELGDDGFVIRVTDKKLYLVGGEQRGTLYSVYEFLEAYLGCRYYSDDVEKVPTMDTILLSEDTPEDKQIPIFTYREVYTRKTAVGAAKQRYNGWQSPNDKNYGGHIEGTISHNLFKLIPPSVYKDEHPEYYSANFKQPCYTNPEVLQIVIEAARKKLTENPNMKYMGLGQEDNSSYCQCDECLKVIAEEGGITGYYYRFVNAVATALKDEFPDVKFNAFAYSDTNYLPTKTLPADNVNVVYATMGGCMSHPYRNDVTNGCVPHKLVEGVWDAPFNETNLPAWDAITSSMIVWDYATNFDNFDAYCPNLTVLLDNMKFFAENGVIGVFEQGCCAKTADFLELRSYIISKILWDPYMSDEEYWAHVDDFLQGYYGPGWESIREYIDFTEELVDDICFCCYEDFSAEELYFPIKPIEKNPDGTYPSDLTADMIRNYTEVDWTKYLNWKVDLENRSYLDKGEECFASSVLPRLLARN